MNGKRGRYKMRIGKKVIIVMIIAIINISLLFSNLNVLAVEV